MKEYFKLPVNFETRIKSKFRDLHNLEEKDACDAVVRYNKLVLCHTDEGFISFGFLEYVKHTFDRVVYGVRHCGHGLVVEHNNLDVYDIPTRKLPQVIHSYDGKNYDTAYFRGIHGQNIALTWTSFDDNVLDVSYCGVESHQARFCEDLVLGIEIGGEDD